MWQNLFAIANNKNHMQQLNINNMKIKSLRSLLILAVLLSGYRTIAMPLNLKTDSTAVRTALQKMNQSYGQAFAKGDSAAFVNCYTPDACIMPANSPEIYGTQGQYAFFKFVYQSGVRNIVFNTAGLFGLTAQFVTEQGNYEMFGENNASLGKGKYLILWKKTPQGWKMFRDMFSSNKPQARPGK
jgi:ketosteroid isomerase-like protein